MNKLLDDSVFNGRYIAGIKPVENAVAEALKDAVGHHARVETENVRAWYAELDPEASKSALEGFANKLLEDLGPSAPDHEQMHTAIARNCAFIESAVQRSRETS